jgi:hypothetical protein
VGGVPRPRVRLRGRLGRIIWAKFPDEFPGLVRRGHRNEYPRNYRQLEEKKLRVAKLATVLAALGLVLAMAGPVGADTSGPNLVNQATATTTAGHTYQADLAWALAQTEGPSVTATNHADATSHDCTGCVAEAVAFQVVIASDTNLYVLTNNATSITTNCTKCTTVSVAEQWVVGDTSQQLRITPLGQLELAAVHIQLALWTHLAPPLQALPHILALADEVSNILSQDVVEVPSIPTPAATPAVSPLAAPAPSGPQVQHYAQVSTG